MNGRSRLLVGICILAVGAGTLWVAATQSQDDVRYVQDLLARPAAHRDGAYTLMGVPEPAEVPFTGPNGTVLAPNPHYADATTDTVSWLRDDVRVYSTRTLRVQEGAGGLLHWTFSNETRLMPADPRTIVPPVEAQWDFGRAGEIFPVVAFSSDGTVHPDTPRVWAHYAKAPEHPMQPKPSQFTGHLLATLPDGTALPEGAIVYEVSQFTAGCSSKFLPPEARAEYEKDYGASASAPG